MAEHNITGARGEDIAAAYLSGLKYNILERNWRSGRLEIDIIARLNDQLVVAEVKTRIAGFIEQPHEAVNKKKQGRLIRAANAYINRSSLNLDIRFDIITVIFETSSITRINHIENAFYPVVRS